MWQLCVSKKPQYSVVFWASTFVNSRTIYKYFLFNHFRKIGNLLSLDAKEEKEEKGCVYWADASELGIKTSLLHLYCIFDGSSRIREQYLKTWADQTRNITMSYSWGERRCLCYQTAPLGQAVKSHLGANFKIAWIWWGGFNSFSSSCRTWPAKSNMCCAVMTISQASFVNLN